MVLDLDDDWSVLRGPPRPPPPGEELGWAVFLNSKGEEVSQRFQILWQEGNPENWNVTWNTPKPEDPKNPLRIPVAKVAVFYDEALLWEHSFERNLLEGDTLSFNLELRGLVEFSRTHRRNLIKSPV